MSTPPPAVSAVPPPMAESPPPSIAPAPGAAVPVQTSPSPFPATPPPVQAPSPLESGELEAALNLIYALLTSTLTQIRKHHSKDISFYHTKTASKNRLSVCMRGSKWTRLARLKPDPSLTGCTSQMKDCCHVLSSSKFFTCFAGSGAARSAASTSKGSSLSTGAIVGIAVGGAAFLALIGQQLASWIRNALHLVYVPITLLISHRKANACIVCNMQCIKLTMLSDLLAQLLT